MKNLFKKIFLYEPPKEDYSFMIPESLEREKNDSSRTNNSKPLYEKELKDSDPKTAVPFGSAVSTNLQDNFNYLNVQYNSLINSDIIMRNFVINTQGKNYNALIIGIDGMVNFDLINNYLLKPLMLPKNAKTNNKPPSITSRINKNIHFDLENYLYNKLIPQNNVKKEKSFDTIISSINSGDCALFVEGLQTAFLIDVKGYQARSISTPKNEIVIRGAQEAFVEKLRTNTSMLRRLINSENLIVERSTVGKVSKTQVAICYMKNIANSYLVGEVKYRINNIKIDYIISSGQLEQLIQDNGHVAFPQIIATERPDKAANHLLEGRVVVLVNGSPYSLIMPGVLIDFLSSPEDLNLKHQYSNLLKFIRILACLITLLLPGLYVAITTYHVELLPTELLFTLAAARNSVPFPVIVEVLLMEISFELIREAGLRIPTPVGPTIGIIGALVLGEAAVSANLVSPVLIIIVALTGICSFTIPDFALSFTFRLYKFLYIFLGYFLRIFGNCNWIIY